jgi:ectoine hydroxylase
MSTLTTIKKRLRAFKPTWTAYNLLHYGQLRGNAQHYRRLGVRKSVLRSLSHRDIKAPSAEVPWLDRPDAKEALGSHPELDSFPPPIREALFGWIDDGVLILERFFDGETVDSINAEVESMLEQGVLAYHYRGNRVMDAYRKSDAVARAVNRPDLVRVLGFILGREVRLFQTINFFEGSQQRPHSDSYHMTTEPLGYLVAIWVALEDVTPESGPLSYFPGSHKLPYVMGEHLGSREDSLFLDPSRDALYEDKIEQVVTEAGIEPREFHAKKGDLLVWHANLVHGGRPVERAGATRRSLVAHYFARGVLCYHEVTQRPALVAA